MRDHPWARALWLVALLSSLPWHAEAQCPVGFSLSSQRTQLYLQYPVEADPAFPEFLQPGGRTSPLAPFDIFDLDPGIGETEALRDRITDLVREDYCEFDVEVLPATTAPTPTAPRWQVVGVGTDTSTASGILFGVAQGVDLTDQVSQDHSRVFSGSFRKAFGGPGEALSGASSTLERWATAIGHTTAHEAGHNFGLSHRDSAAVPGDDEQNWHIMATGSTGLDGEMRAGRNRHFGDREYEILGHNLGLRIKTLYNWEFVNPNAEDAQSLDLTVLTRAASLTPRWFYEGDRSPWKSPTIAYTGAQEFRGVLYNRFVLTYAMPQAWSGGAPGVVPGGADFRVGVTFAEPDPVFVVETRVKDGSRTDLGLHPRLLGFDAGVPDAATGDFNLSAFNLEGDKLMLEDVRVVYLPRLASIDSMFSNATPLDMRALPVELRRPGQSFAAPRSLEVRDSASFRLATLRDQRFIDERYDATRCERGLQPSADRTPTPRAAADAEGAAEMEYCPDGWGMSLFPSTYVYVTATVVDPAARYWDRAQARYVDGPLRTQVFYQFAGMVPDLNGNGIDDLIDLRMNASRDQNSNGVVDEAE